MSTNYYYELRMKMHTLYDRLDSMVGNLPESIYSIANNVFSVENIETNFPKYQIIVTMKENSKKEDIDKVINAIYRNIQVFVVSNFTKLDLDPKGEKYSNNIIYNYPSLLADICIIGNCMTITL